MAEEVIANGVDTINGMSVQNHLKWLNALVDSYKKLLTD